MPNLSDFRSYSPLIFVCSEPSCAGGPDREYPASRHRGVRYSRERLTVPQAFEQPCQGPLNHHLRSIVVRRPAPCGSLTDWGEQHGHHQVGAACRVRLQTQFVSWLWSQDSVMSNESPRHLFLQ
jgi:hypothetical protein